MESIIIVSKQTVHIIFMMVVLYRYFQHFVDYDEDSTWEIIAVMKITNLGVLEGFPG